MVYFIQQGDDGHIKIGSARNAWTRLDALQTANPHPLRLLFVAEGGIELERELHRRFDHWRTRGEWFRPHPDFLWLIARCAAGFSDQLPRARYDRSKLRLSPVHLPLGLRKEFAAMRSERGWPAYL